MIIGRVLGYLSLCLLMMVFGAEGLRYLEGGQRNLLLVSDILDFIQNHQIESDKGDKTWAEYLSPVIGFEAIFFFLYIWVMLTILFRKRN
ncbi:hypothetical protein N9D02_04870 [Emcibacteraceae bacterium]|jgi:hypothetical protein|nr:hypothetical protein [Emcibacteraceae bacterium]MDG1021127.1 hypothetical protein [Emcibacteraceae bacterium]MDG1727694.1 hypothetical protein [Emcibacteraceae bacterium]